MLNLSDLFMFLYNYYVLVPVKSLKAKWKNLRDTYKKYKQSQVTFSGQGAKKYGNWVWGEHMTFVDSTTKLRPTDSPLDTNPIIPITAEDNVNEISPLSPTDGSLEEPKEPILKNERETDAENERSLSNTAESGSNLNQRRRRRNLDPSDRIIEYLKTRSAKKSTPNTCGNLVNVSCDRLDMTFLGFADSVKKLSSNNQAIIKLQITKLITEYVLKEMTSDSRSNSSNTYISTPESITLFADVNHSNHSSDTHNNIIQHLPSNTQSHNDIRKIFIHQPSTSGINTHNDNNKQNSSSNSQNQNLIILPPVNSNDERSSQIKNSQNYVVIQPSDHTNDNDENDDMSTQNYFANWKRF